MKLITASGLYLVALKWQKKPQKLYHIYCYHNFKIQNFVWIYFFQTGTQYVVLVVWISLCRLFCPQTQKLTFSASAEIEMSTDMVETHETQMTASPRTSLAADPTCRSEDSSVFLVG